MIIKKFGIDNHNKKEIKRRDNVVLIPEIRDLSGDHLIKRKDNKMFKPLERNIIPLSPEEAKELFLKRYYKLKKRNL